MPPSSAPQLPPPVAATVHIYRGLMDRATTWRVRIDMPTNWAIVTCGTGVSFVLSDQTHSHAVLLLLMPLTLGFLLIEARRTRYYNLWGCWLRLLETEYLAPILRDNHIAVDEAWQRKIVRDMENPHFKMSLLQVVARRLRDNYLAINGFLVLCWLLKLLSHSNLALRMDQTDTFINRATLGPLEGWMVFAGVFAYNIALVLVAFATTRQRYPSIEVMSRERALQFMASPFQQPLGRRQSQSGLRDHFAGDGVDHQEPRD